MLYSTQAYDKKRGERTMQDLKTNETMQGKRTLMIYFVGILIATVMCVIAMFIAKESIQSFMTTWMTFYVSLSGIVLTKNHFHKISNDKITVEMGGENKH